VLEHPELGVLAHRGLHFLHERQRELAQAQCVRAAGGQFPEAHADAHRAFVVAFEQTLGDQVGDQPVRGRARQVGTAGDLGGGLRHPRRVEAVEHAHHTLDDRVARARVSHRCGV